LAGRVFGDLEFIGTMAAWSPSLRIAVLRSLDMTRRAATGSATLRFTQASLEACPLRFDLHPSIALRPCIGAAGGIVEAVGSGVEDAHPHVGPWAAILAHGRLTWAPGVVTVEAEIGGTVPLVRDSFVFDPNVPVYRAPPVAAVGRLGLGLRFR
jgi:hypothetical protein